MMENSNKEDCIELVIIVPCQRCGAKFYAEIEAANKYTTLRDTIIRNTEIVSGKLFGKDRLVCAACSKEFDDLIDKRKVDVDKFLRNEA